MLRRIAVAGVAVLAVVAGTTVVQVAGGAPSARADGLLPYADCDAYLAQVREELKATATPYGIGGGDAVAATSLGSSFDVGESGVETLASTDGAQVAGGSPTGTNVQESGVDEPDRAKLAGGRIVTIDAGVVRVRSTGSTPTVLGSLPLESSAFATYQDELMIVGDRVVVVQNGTDTSDRPKRGSTRVPPTASFAPRYGFDSEDTVTRVSLVDVVDGRPTLRESATYDGSYLSARVIDGTVRLVTRFEPSLAGVTPTGSDKTTEAAALAENRRLAGAITVEEALPQVVRRAGDDATKLSPAVDCSEISHPREDSGLGMLVVTTLRPGEGLDPVDRDAVSTGGELVYASADRLYVATTGNRFGPQVGMLASSLESGQTSGVPVEDLEPTTEVHAFDTSDGDETRYVASGSVPGYVIGRWAFSEHEGVLRVATTRQPENGSGGPSSSMVVKLTERDDGRLVETGRIAGLGKTEEIKSVRYLGELAAVVTFRETDPLYLLDLGDDPRVLGELKVPGFSTYLHPIGDGLLLAVGQDATNSGQITGVQASVFDVNDPSEPKLVDRLSLGAGESAALYESRAFTYDPARRLLLLPFIDWDYTGGEVRAIRVATGGALTQERIVEFRTNGFDGQQPLERVLVDDEHFYGVQLNQVGAADLDTLLRTD